MATQVDLSTIPISPDGGNDSSSSAEKAKEEVVTVFHDPNNFNVIHPLAHKWVLWYTRPPTGKGETWSALLKVVFAEIDSVETFWGVYNHLPGMVSELPPKTDYHLFKHKLDDKHKKEHPTEPPKWKPIRPEWEDDANKHGGRWSYTFKNKQGVDIDNAFLHTMLAAIGETLDNDDEDEVTGVVVNVRKAFYRISVWTRTMGKAIPKGSSDGDQAVVKPRSAEQGKAIILGIGKRFKEIIKVPPGEVVEFLSHADAALAGSSRAKARFTV